MTQNRRFGRYAVFENTSKEELIKFLKSLVSSKKYRIDPRHGYSVEETITKYDNVESGVRYQGVLEKV